MHLVSYVLYCLVCSAFATETSSKFHIDQQTCDLQVLFKIARTIARARRRSATVECQQRLLLWLRVKHCLVVLWYFSVVLQVSVRR